MFNLMLFMSTLLDIFDDFDEVFGDNDFYTGDIVGIVLGSVFGVIFLIAVVLTIVGIVKTVKKSKTITENFTNKIKQSVKEITKKDNKEVCPYCGTIFKDEENRCSGCGAPRKK